MNKISGVSTVVFQQNTSLLAVFMVQIKSVLIMLVILGPAQEICLPSK